MRQVALGHGRKAGGQAAQGHAVLFGDPGLFGLVGGALLLGQRALRQGLGFDPLLLDRRVAEGQNGLAHLAELVLALRAGHLDGGVPAHQLAHVADHLEDRAHDGARQGPARQQGDQAGRGQADNKADQGRAGLIVLRLADRRQVDFGLALDGLDGLFDRRDVFVRDAVRRHQAARLFTARRIPGQGHRQRADVLVPLVGGLFGPVGIRDARVAGVLSDFFQGLLELGAMPVQPLQVVGVVRQQEAAQRILLLGQAELRYPDRPIGGVGELALIPDLAQRKQIVGDRHAHDGDGAQHHREGDKQFPPNGQVGQDIHEQASPYAAFCRRYSLTLNLTGGALRRTSCGHGLRRSGKVPIPALEVPEPDAVKASYSS